MVERFQKDTDSDFILSKWYMDCVNDTGDVFIGYLAGLRWKKLHVNYASILLHDQTTGRQEHTSVKKQNTPNIRNNRLKWEPSRLGAKGTWESLDEPVSKTLLNSENGRLDWSCHQPKSNAVIIYKTKLKLSGFGYTEQIEMTIKPWELPIKELRWGRYLSATDTIVWIIWKGSVPVNLVFYNRKEMDDAVISDDCLIINQGDFILSFTDKIILREGPLISTALSQLPLIHNFFPDKILHTHDMKWKSKGILRMNKNNISEGWIIH